MDLYQKISDYRLLEKCFKSICKGKKEDVLKSSRGIDGVSIERFKSQERKNLENLQKKLSQKKFAFKPIKGMAKAKKSGGYRLISISTIEDRIIHRAILSVLNEFIYPHINTGVSYCGVKKNFWKKSETKEISIKSAMKKIIQHTKNKNFWIFESDIQGFFDNVPKHRMICRIFKTLPDPSLKKLIREIINFKIGNTEYVKAKGIEVPNIKYGVSQGSSLSPIFANLYLSKFDLFMKSKFGDKYIRYVDDFIVLCQTKEEAELAKKMSISFLGKEKLELSPKKTHILNLKNQDKLIFLGIRISRLGIFPKKTTGEIRQWLNNSVLNVKLKRNKSMSFIETVNCKIDGFANFYQFYHVKEIFGNLDNFLEVRKNIERNLFRGMKKFNDTSIKELINQKDWQSFFK